MDEPTDLLIHQTPSLLDEEEQEPEDVKEESRNWNEVKVTNQALRERLQQIRADRRRCLAQQQRCNELKEDLQHTLTVATYQHDQAITDFMSAVAELHALESTLAISQHWNVTASDCFFVSCEHGTVASINGLRIGAESSTVVSCNNVRISTPQPNVPTFFSFGAGAGASETASYKIPWREINAALGQVVLLLSMLERSLGVNDKPVFRHELQCQGSTSKIGLRKATGTTAFYNLYYIEEAFHFFAKRNFNTAVTMLLECVQDAATAVQMHDPTIVVPYKIDKRTGTIAGLSVVFFASAAAAANTSGGSTSTEHSQQQHAAEWTRAMKYLLTNIKHVMVFRAVGLWTSNKRI